VSLLGATAPLHWKQDDDALVIDVPATMPTAIASSFKIGF
jgi:alpha-L-fucosidase